VERLYKILHFTLQDFTRAPSWELKPLAQTQEGKDLRQTSPSSKVKQRIGTNVLDFGAKTVWHLLCKTYLKRVWSWLRFSCCPNYVNRKKGRARTYTTKSKG